MCQDFPKKKQRLYPYCVMNFVLTKVIILCSLLLVSQRAVAEPETMYYVKNPTAVEEVLSGKRTVANAAWWGFDKSDSTDALQGAIDSGASKVIVPYMDKPWIVRPIKLVSNQEIVFYPGVIVEAISNKVKPNSFVIYHSDWNTEENEHKRGDALFSAICKKNITLRGYRATFRMQKKEYMAENNTSEFRHVINLRSCSNITIKGLTLKDSGGDGIFIGRYYQYPGVKNYCENILIKDVFCDNNLRCGIGVISADGLIIEYCVLVNTIGTWPQAGIAFEPDWKVERLKNIVVRKSTISNNRSLGLFVSLHNLESESVDVDMVFDNICVTDSLGKIATAYAGIKVRDTGDDKRPGGLLKFKNITIEDMGYGIRIEKSKNSCSVSFENCVWKNITRESPIIIQARKYLDLSDIVKFPGGVEFINCQVFDNENRPAIKASGEIQRDKEGLYEIRGDLYVQNPNRLEDLYDWNGATLHNVDVMVRYGLSDSVGGTYVSDPNVWNDIKF